MDQVCGVLEMYKVDIDQVCGELTKTAVILLTDTLTPALSQRERELNVPSPLRGDAYMDVGGRTMQEQLSRVRVRGQDRFGLLVTTQFRSTGAGGLNPEPVHRPGNFEFDA